MDRLLSWVAIFCLLLAGVAEGDSSGRKAGFLLLREGMGARAEAMGGAYTAEVGDQTAAYWNPAGVAALQGKDFLLAHQRSFQGIQQSYAGWAYGNQKRGLALSLGLYSVGGLEARTGPTAQPLGTFGIYDVNAGFSYAQRFGSRLYAGFSVRALHEAIEAERASGVGVDLGVLYQTGIEGVTVGVAYLNLGRMEKLATSRVPLPRTFRAGLAASRGKVTGTLDLRLPEEGASGVHTGLEYRVHPALFLRGRYRSGNDVRDWSFGVGLQRRNWRVEYAFVPGALGLEGSHRVAVGIR